VGKLKKQFRSQDGSVFILSMCALLVLLILGVLSIQAAIQSLNRAAHEKESAVAFNLAEAAADSAEAWLRKQTTPPGYGTMDPFGGTRTLANGTYSALIYPDADNDGKLQKTFTIVGTGHAAHGNATRQVIYRMQEQSFALYSYFTDQEVSPISNGTIWFYARDRLYGPVHTNDRFHISWGSTSADPIFYDTVSSTGTTVEWSPGTPGNARDWRRVLEGGQSALTTGTDRIPLPQSTDRQRNAAWGADHNFPSSTGVYVPNNGAAVDAGIYVKGDSTITFSVDNPTGNQIIAIKQGSTTTTITVDREAGTTTIADGSASSPHTYSGTTNGMIFSSGNITSLKGALANNYEDGSQILQRNAWTIATNVTAGNDVTITDNLVYQTPPKADQPMTHPSNLRAPCLGIVAEDVVLSSSCPNEMTIDGVILAGGENTTNGSFYYAGWNSVKRNNLHVLGGIIQKKRGPIGTFNINNNVQINGYNKDYKYDTRMVDNPPPFFPTTGQYDMKSWQYR
jgi:hypothetical protein